MHDGKRNTQATQPIGLNIITGGIERQVELDDKWLRIADEQAIFLGQAHSSIARILFQNPDRPFLSERLQSRMPNGYARVPISPLFKDLVRDFRTVGLENHPIKVGTGRSSWYGLLSDDQDARMLCERGIDDIKLDSTGRVKKRIKPFEDTLKYYEDRHASIFSRHQKGIIGGAVVTLTVGASTIYALRRQPSGDK